MDLYSSEEPLIINFRQLWANNADAISYIYTNTGSTSS